MDDIGFLKERAREETFLFVLDSAKRDVRAWPSPSHYQIEFDAPFNDVVGFDVLFATIPRTEYVIDEDRNALKYAVNGTTYTTMLEPGDYNLIQLCEALNAVLEGGLKVEPHSAPYQLRSRIKFYCDTEFTLYRTGSTIAKSLGFYQDIEEYASSLHGAVETLSYQGPYPGFDTLSIQALDNTPSVRQPFTASTSGTLSKVVVHLANQSGTVSVRIVTGDGVVYGETTVDPANPEGVVEEGLPLTQGSVYYVELSSPEGSSDHVYISAARDAEPPVQSLDQDSGEFMDNPNDLSMATEVYVTTDRHEVDGPGLVDLTGERHVIVNCPEIESNLHRSRKTEAFHSGVAMVRLGNLGYTEQRFDFVSFPRRDLVNPIGKLKTLTIKLMKPNGQPYNARGVDHTLLCNIRYLVPTPKPEDMRLNVLNPEYTPDLNDHLIKKWARDIQLRDDDEFRRYAGSRRF